MEFNNKFVLSIKEASIFTGISQSTIKRLIVIDDYATVEGATRAVDNFCKKNKKEIKKLPFYLAPSYIEF